ncbi:MAG TPA: hypothetical protein OQH54_06775 [Nitrosopumilus sp.]|nr:hypothetical protein [Thermoproteota archaeon]HJJ23400.1 hypothetical protein [Nitrosopumilus sp.]
MSENEENNPNNFAVIEQTAKKYFSEIEHTVPHIQQILFDLQNECYKTWKNTVNANISLQKEFLAKSGFNYVLPEDAKSIFENMGEETVKYRSLYHKMIISTIESGKKNIKTWNDNADVFVNLNKKIMDFWLSAFMPK